MIFGEPGEGAACQAGALWAEVVEKNEGEALLSFNLSGPVLDNFIFALGHMPLPPYIRKLRAEDDRDAERLPDPVCRQAGAVAAPTAGLHFTPGLVEALRARAST